jgi:hypothetical protein
MNEPTVVNITYEGGGRGRRCGYYVDQPNWDGGTVVGLEEIAAYIENDSEILLPIVVEETKRAYGLRLLKELAAEIRRMAPAAPEVRPHGYPGAALGV